MPSMNTSKKKAALVTGSSRGVGKAIALELGAAGWIVYVSARSSKENPSDEGIAGTIEETAEEIIQRGGKAIPVRCDHSKVTDVNNLLARVSSEQGRIDLLVNNAWGGYEFHDNSTFTLPFWEQPISRWFAMFERGLLPTILTTSRFAPLFLSQQSGVVVNTVAWLEGNYLGNLYYDVAKSAILRATKDMALELRSHGVAVVAIAPGFVRTERVLRAHAADPFDLSQTESPSYIAKAIRAIAEDPKIIENSGELLYVGNLAVKYAFTDVDGKQPPVFKVS
jgi:NAD(P)-dependent dehydrogenase (short-subunit alcohol dehydrogenase family)